MIYIDISEIYLKIKEYNIYTKSNINFQDIAKELNISSKKLKRQIEYGKIKAIDLFKIAGLLNCPADIFIKYIKND